jgi:hypothetical protein
MSDVGPAMQRAAVSTLLASEAVVALVADSEDGPAVFAALTKFANVFPRVTIDKPQVIPLGRICGLEVDEVYLTLHCWAAGGDSLVCGELAGAVRAALDADLQPEGFAIKGRHHFRGQREAGDPDPTNQHLVCTFRYILQPA